MRASDFTRSENSEVSGNRSSAWPSKLLGGSSIEGLSRLSSGQFNRSDTLGSSAVNYGSEQDFRRSRGVAFSENPVTRNISARALDDSVYGDLQKQRSINKAAKHMVVLDDNYSGLASEMASTGKIPKVTEKKYGIKREDFPDVVSTFLDMSREKREDEKYSGY